MQHSTPAIDVFSYLKFQLSLLRMCSLGARTPQVEELERLLNSDPRNDDRREAVARL